MKNSLDLQFAEQKALLSFTFATNNNPEGSCLDEQKQREGAWSGLTFRTASPLKLVAFYSRFGAACPFVWWNTGMRPRVETFQCGHCGGLHEIFYQNRNLVHV
jgi:hypothetical protein